MSRLEITLRDARAAFAPGDDIEGTAAWHLDAPPENVELRLFWYTSGRGDRDVEVVRALPFDGAGRDDRRAFRFTAPAEPLSFSGKLISLIWALELVAEPGAEAARVEILLSHSGREIRLEGAGEADAG